MMWWRKAAWPGVACVVFLSVAMPATAQSAASTDTSLYQRLGGYDVIAAVVDDFLGRFDGDVELVPFLGGINAANGARVRQHFVDFICARTGGPCLYNGRDMSAAHEGMAIENSHFDAVLRHFRAALDAQRVSSSPRDELLDQLRGMRSAIVGGR